jgi:hypothetical protein
VVPWDQEDFVYNNIGIQQQAQETDLGLTEGMLQVLAKAVQQLRVKDLETEA